MPKSNKGLATSMEVVGSGLQHLAIFPGAAWILSSQTKVNTLKEALAHGNVRYFSGRAAVGLFFAGALTNITGQGISAYKRHEDNDTLGMK